uniref:Non-specific serine/threonine protein kinase n=1 Tax=Meloidogyne javanica TaxID=6303 RepID=A0A915LWS7_MELJA
MSKEDSSVQNDEKPFRANNLSLVVGDSESSSSEETQDMRSRMQSFAINMGDEGMPDSTIFVEDCEVIAPSTSLLTDQNDLQRQNEFINVDNFIIDEIFTEKPPKILKDYLFGNVIGEGSYSKVKEVLHVNSLIRRAIKIIKDKRLRKIPGGEQNVQREIDVLRRLNHSNVVKVVDIFRIEEKQKLYIVMEYCVCSLQQLLDNCAEKMLPEFQAHLYFTQLLDGLDFLHGKRIIHKDIKPGNLLLSLDGVLKICDLGVAELLAPSSVGSADDWCTLIQGTPKFQPPEIVSGAQGKFRGSLVDIWACGVTLYNMVSGEYPFEGDVIMKLFENIINHPLHMPSNVQLSADLEQLLHGMLRKEPEMRWNSLRIRASKWFLHSHKIDDKRIVHVPAVKDVPAHRPLGVFPYLEQLYSNSDYYEETSELKDELDLNGHIEQNCEGNGQCTIQSIFPINPDLPVADLSSKQNEISPLSNTKLDSPNIQWRVANDQHFKKNGDEEREPFINSAIMSNEEKEKKKNVKIQFYDDNEGEGCSNNVVNQCNNENADWDKHRKIYSYSHLYKMALITNIPITSATVDNMSRNDYLRWVNECLQAEFSKIEQLHTGAGYCLFTEILFPGTINMKKVKFNSRMELDWLSNWKIVQTAWKQLGVEKVVAVEKLIKGKFQDNFEFLQWFKKFFDANYDGHEFDPVEMRFNEELPKENKLKATALLRQPQPAKTGGPSRVPPPQRVGSNVSMNSNSGCGASSKKSSPTSLSTSTKKPAMASTTGRRAAPAASTPAPRPAPTGQVAQNKAPPPVVDLQDLKIKDQQLEELRGQLAETDEVICGLEKERDFYFAKLRKIEVLCQGKFIVKTEEGFAPPEELEAGEANGGLSGGEDNHNGLHNVP